MDDQSSLGSSLTVSEKTSTSSDGQYPSVVEQRPNLVYKDETGSVALMYLGERLHVGVTLNRLQIPYSRIKHWQSVIFELERQLSDKGITRYYCTAGNYVSYRFAKFMGFKDTDEISEHEDYVLLRKDFL